MAFTVVLAGTRVSVRCDLAVEVHELIALMEQGPARAVKSNVPTSANSLTLRFLRTIRTASPPGVIASVALDMPGVLNGRGVGAATLKVERCLRASGFDVRKVAVRRKTKTGLAWFPGHMIGDAITYFEDLVATTGEAKQ